MKTRPTYIPAGVVAPLLAIRCFTRTTFTTIVAGNQTAPTVWTGDAAHNPSVWQTNTVVAKHAGPYHYTIINRIASVVFGVLCEFLRFSAGYSRTFKRRLMSALYGKETSLKRELKNILNENP